MSVGILLRSGGALPDEVLSLLDRGLASVGVLVIASSQDAQQSGEPPDVGSSPLLIVRLERFGWSYGLNAGLLALQAHDRSPDMVLCVSVDAIPTPQAFLLMESSLRNGTWSCAFPSYGLSERSYRVPRNTCAMWPMSLFQQLGMFDQSLDGGQGMEDYDLALRAYSRLLRLPLRVPATVDLRHRRGEGFAARTDREEKQMISIASRYPPVDVAAVHACLEIEVD
jgi:hypothetical protein